MELATYDYICRKSCDINAITKVYSYRMFRSQHNIICYVVYTTLHIILWSKNMVCKAIAVQANHAHGVV